MEWEFYLMQGISHLQTICPSFQLQHFTRQ